MKRFHIIAPLVLVAGCAAYAVPNLYTAMQRSKQKRSMAAIRDTANAIEAYETTHGAYPRTLPRTLDGWNRPLLYHASGNHYALRSTGRDGKNDGQLTGLGTSFDDDLVLVDGTFRRYGEGVY